MSQTPMDVRSMLEATSSAETPMRSRPPMGPQGHLLRDMFDDGNFALRQSPFGGYTAVEQGESIEHVARRSSLQPTRSGPVECALVHPALKAMPIEQIGSLPADRGKYDFC